MTKNQKISKKQRKSKKQALNPSHENKNGKDKEREKLEIRRVTCVVSQIKKKN